MPIVYSGSIEIDGGEKLRVKLFLRNTSEKFENFFNDLIMIFTRKV